ncbi:centromere protein P [Macrotis lagotis]|uniref:centromere protein P n=1 Tax=Macrotis lagotis TaxID=92651 RepID=UPI003D681940
MAAGRRGPRAELRAPGAEVAAPRAELRAPRAELRAPRAELAALRAELRAPGAEVAAPRAELRAPRDELRAPRAELAALRAEVAALRGRLRRGPGPGRDPGLARAQLARLQAGLAFLTRATGVSLADFSLEEARGGSGLVRRGRLGGSCRGLAFHLDFELLETQSEERPLAAITNLSIIMESVEGNELSRFVARTEEKRDLFLFFRSLHSFMEWCEYRKQTFQYFKEKHPEVVQLPGGPGADSMVLRSRRLTGFELVVVWMVHIDEEGQVLPVLDLLTKVPEQALTLNQEKVVERAPRCFRSLLQLAGVEAALAGLVRLLDPPE